MAARVGGQITAKALNPFEEAGTLLEEFMQERIALRVNQTAAKTLQPTSERENVNTQTGRPFSEERGPFSGLRRRAAFQKADPTRI